MKKNKEWQLQEAKNKFSEVFNESLKNGAQTITRNGKERVLLIALKDYQQLLNQKSNSLSSFLSSSPLKDEGLSFERSKDLARDIDL